MSRKIKSNQVPRSVILIAAVLIVLVAGFAAPSPFLPAVSAGGGQRPGLESIAKVNSGNAMVPTESRPGTTTTIWTNTNPSPYGPVQLFAQVVCGCFSTPSGHVRFYLNGAAIGTATLNSGIGWISTGKLAVGANSLTAEFETNRDYEGSASSVYVQQVVPANISIQASAIPNPSQFKEKVAFHAFMESNGARPSGLSVVFYYGSTQICFGESNKNGEASCTYPKLPEGSDTVTAVESGNYGFNAASASMTQTVK